MPASVTIRKKTYHKGQPLKAVIVFYPESNNRYAAMLDCDNKLVGFGTDRLYHPDGGMSGIRSITDTGGLVDGSTYYGYDCRHAHDNTYVLQYSEA